MSTSGSDEAKRSTAATETTWDNAAGTKRATGQPVVATSTARVYPDPAPASQFPWPIASALAEQTLQGSDTTDSQAETAENTEDRELLSPRGHTRTQTAN